MLETEDGLQLVKDEDEEEEEEESDGGLDGIPEHEETKLENIEQGNPKKQKHASGAIVRVKMLNFVTYTNVEFRPGPSLNMVIGPNGTGKSTLVCAICLGLGWSPIHLGRAKDIGAYVKHGCKEASIEIEVQGKPTDKVNPVIKRTITENNKSFFFINGKTATHKSVQQLMKSFSIQIDNLCQFLPQDRVAEFAALDPVNLLRETQRAAAKPEVLEWHEALQKIGKEQKTLKAQREADMSTLANLESRQRALEPDVARLRERRDVLREIEMHKRAKPFARYRVSRTVAHTAKARHKELEREFENLRRAQEPTLKKVNQKKAYRDKVSAVYKEKKRQEELKEKQLMEYKRRYLDETEAKIKDKRAELSTATKKERERKNEEIKIRNQITKMKEIYQNQPEEVDVQGYNQRMRDKSQEMAALKEKTENIRVEVDPKVVEGRAKKAEIQNINRELEKLQSASGQRENLLSSLSKDTYRAYTWIRENADKFEKPVFGPPLLECRVKDQRYVEVIEGIVRSNALAITCQSQKDYQLLMNEFFGSKRAGTKGMGLAEVTIMNYSGTALPTLEHQRSPMSTQELRHKHRMDGWALDFLEGPEPVLNMLCHESRIHSTPVTLRTLSPQENNGFEKIFQSWVTGRDHYTVRWRKEYGDDAKSVNTRSIPRAAIFNTQQVDQAATQRLEDRIQALNFECSEIEKYVNEVKARYDAIQKQINGLNREKIEINKEKEKKLEAQRHWVELGTRIEQEEGKLAQKMNGNYKQEAEIFGKQLSALCLDRAKGALEFATMVNSYINSQTELLKLQLWDIEANSDVTHLESRNAEVNDLLKSKEMEVAQAKVEMNRAKREALDDGEIIKQLLEEDDLTPEDREYLRVLNERALSLEELDTEIDVIQGRLSLLHEGNPNAIRDYERRAKEIEALQKTIQEKQVKMDQLETAIKEVKAKWEPALDKVVVKISTAFSESFEKIGCAGEVKVNKTEDFDKWEIQILVKFRESEKLQILTNQRQSGGERAVSTVFYLMALQSMAQAPFRVVDEINQGMDPRNERLVHHRMVNIACQEHTSQYFLITPKLLANLTYHPRMKVHTINSGDYVEEDYKIDVMKCIAKMKALGTARA
ncbi:hypothetical protein EV426DRAFT_528601 [Tirmania nivea]|nr:hypothetical protein EV426DRAFT_528601 [Tirmania nivea]